LTENILYWTLVIAGIIVFILKKKYRKETFLSFDDLLERQNTGDPAQELEEIVVKKDDEKYHHHHKISKISPIFKHLELVNASHALDNSSKPFGLGDEKEGTAFVEQSFSKLGDDPMNHTLPLSSRGI